MKKKAPTLRIKEIKDLDFLSSQILEEAIEIIKEDIKFLKENPTWL